MQPSSQSSFKTLTSTKNFSSYPFVVSPCPQPQPHPQMVCFLSQVLSFLEISYRWNHTVWGLLCQESFTWHYVVLDLSVFCVSEVSSFSLLSGILLCRGTTFSLNMNQLGDVGWFPVWVYYEGCYCDCSHMGCVLIYLERILGLTPKVSHDTWQPSQNQDRRS